MKNTAQCTKLVFDCLSELRREYQRMPVPVAVTGEERQLQQQLREKEEQVRGWMHSDRGHRRMFWLNTLWNYCVWYNNKSEHISSRVCAKWCGISWFGMWQVHLFTYQYINHNWLEIVNLIVMWLSPHHSLQYQRDLSRLEESYHQQLEEEQRRLHHRIQRNEEVIQQKDAMIERNEARIQQKDATIERNEAMIHQNVVTIQQNQATIQQNQATIQRKDSEIVDLRNQLESRPWILRREEVEMTNEAIGGGAYGEVKVAIFRGTRVAAKHLHEIIVSRHNTDIFTREMDISCKIHHPNIVQFLGATRVNNPILLYELMATSLYKRLQDDRSLTHPQITELCCDIASALCYLHLWRPDPIIHRDVSSPNVLMEPLANNRWRSKLSDFGAASLQLHVKTVIPGNPAYAAPEARIPQDHSPMMDIYSFGVLATEVTLHSAPEMNCRRREAKAHTIDWIPMKEIVLRCIKDDRDQRLTSVELLRELHKINWTRVLLPLNRF